MEKHEVGMRVLDTVQGYGRIVYVPNAPGYNWLKVELDNGLQITSAVENIRVVEEEKD